MHFRLPWCIFDILDALSITFELYYYFLILWAENFSSRGRKSSRAVFDMSKIRAITFYHLIYTSSAVPETWYTFDVPGDTYDVSNVYICSPLLKIFDQWEPGITFDALLTNTMHIQYPRHTLSIHFRTLPLVFKFCGRRTLWSKVENQREWLFDMSKIHCFR